MIQIIISPAKMMDFDDDKNDIKPTQPLFAEKTKQLVNVCRKLSIKEIAEIMKINPSMARDVHEYYQTFQFDTTPKRAAALAYNGIAYKGLNAHDFSKEDFLFAQKSLSIISGLYGVVRPMDEIKPYRLEMQRKIVPKGYKTLYEFWDETLTRYFAEKLSGKSPVVVNVASKEYGKVLAMKKMPSNARMVEMNFLQQKGDELKQIVVHTKKARGMLARFIIKNRITDIEDVKAFDAEGYFFNSSLSQPNVWFFVR